MDFLDERPAKPFPPAIQAKILASITEGDELTVDLQNGGSASGQVTAVTINGATASPDEIHVQFLDYDSTYRDDGHPNHTVSITQSDEGEFETAELTYSWTDLGRVRTNTVDAADAVWKNLPHFRRNVSLSRRWAALLSLKQAGLTNTEIAERYGVDTERVEDALAEISEEHWRAKQTVELLESLDVPASRHARTERLPRQDVEQSDWSNWDDLDERIEPDAGD